MPAKNETLRYIWKLIIPLRVFDTALPLVMRHQRRYAFGVVVTRPALPECSQALQVLIWESLPNQGLTAAPAVSHSGRFASWSGSAGAAGNGLNLNAFIDCNVASM